MSLLIDLIWGSYMNRHFPLLRSLLHPGRAATWGLVAPKPAPGTSPLRGVETTHGSKDMWLENLDKTSEISEFYSQKRAIPKANDHIHHLPTCLCVEIIGVMIHYMPWNQDRILSQPSYISCFMWLFWWVILFIAKNPPPPILQDPCIHV